MAIELTEDQVQLFLDNDYSVEELQEAVAEARQNGKSDKEIMESINNKLKEFEETEESKNAGLFDKVDIREYFKDELAKRKEWEVNHPIISNIQKDFQPGYRAAEKEMELRSKYGYNAPVGEELKTTLNKIGQEFIPAVNTAVAIGTGGIGAGAKGLGAQIGKSALQGSVQGGVLGLTHDLGDNGLNRGNIGETLKGATIGSLIGGLLPTAAPVTEKAGKGLGWLVGKLYYNLYPGLKEKTVRQLVKPNSKALGMSEDSAENLLMDTTERVRNAYNNLLKNKGDVISQAEDNLRNNTNRVNIQDVLNDIKGTFDQYQGENINAARNLTGNLENNLNELAESGTTPLEEFYNYIGKSEKPDFYSKEKEAEAFDILSKATGKSVNWLKSQLNSNNFKGGTGKRKEFIDDLVSNLDDKLEILKSGNGNDYKYYYDANLGYGNRDMTDVNAVERLVRNAYDDIINKNFANEISDPLSREIAGAEQSYKYLLRDLAEKARNSEAFNTAEKRFENIIKNLPDEVKSDFADKFIADSENILQGRNTISPIDLQKIKQQVGQMTNWADTTRPKIQNTILEQIYGKMRGRLEDLSPELAEANKDFAALKSFQENEGLKRILKPGDNIDSASSALRNYNSTITSGNKGRNIQDLENVLIRNGQEPFLNTIDDINAANELLKSAENGFNPFGLTDKVKLLSRPILWAHRGINRLGSKISDKGYNIKTAIKGLAVPLMYRPQLQGSVEYNDYNE